MNTLLKWCGAIVLVILASCGSASAQENGYWYSPIDVSGAYSYVHGVSSDSNGTFPLNGGEVTASYRLRPSIAAVADVGMYHFSGLPIGLESSMYTYLFGPQVSVFKYRRFKPFVHVLAGAGRLDATSGAFQAGENAFAMAAGGGVDARFLRHFSVRVVQVDYLLTRFDRPNGTTTSQNNIRISTGIIYHFGSARN